MFLSYNVTTDLLDKIFFLYKFNLYAPSENHGNKKMQRYPRLLFIHIIHRNLLKKGSKLLHNKVQDWNKTI